MTTEPRPAGADREEPADPRVYLAAERTLLAWIRTGLAMMGFGFVVARFGLFLRELAATELPQSGATTGLSLWAGTALVLLGVATNLLAAAGHIRFLRRLGILAANDMMRGRSSVVVAVVLALIGLLMALYLLLFRP